MRCLFVLYDDRCGLCRRVRGWAEAQPALVPLAFVPADSDEARRRFPSLAVAPGAAPEELVAVSDEGYAYVGDSAWLMVMYALEGYREWSLRLASPALRPLARRAFDTFSRHRKDVSAWLSLDADDHALGDALRRIPDAPFVLGPGGDGRHPFSLSPRP